ncbi:hypothetical protein GCM10027217_25710 [Pseudomaricurvus hydrocarbonicus]
MSIALPALTELPEPIAACTDAEEMTALAAPAAPISLPLSVEVALPPRVAALLLLLIRLLVPDHS